VAKIQINRRAKQTRVVVAGRNRQARGELELPTGIAAELADDSSVTLQFHSSDAECLEANLSEFRKQTAELLRVRGNGAPSAIYDFTAVESEIETFIGQYAAIEGVGAIFVHRRDGVIFEKGLGAFSKDRIYLIASSSKMVTAGVLMRLADDGLLDMDEPIVDVVGWGNHNPTVTPAQLVSNSSGLVGLFDPQVPDYVCQYFYAGTLQACGQSIFTTPQDDVQVTPPDTVFRYGGGQWQLAGAVAEVVSGKTWHELIAETYNQPCGLESLAYNNHFLQLAGLFSYPLAFNSDPGTLMPTANPNGEGGAYTTTSDYGKLLLMHLRGGLCEGERVLSTASVDRMHADRILEEYGGSTGGPFAGYGFGWWIDRSDPGLIADPGAYGAYPWLDLERDYAGLILIEADALLGQQLFNRLLPLVRAAVAAAN
jgi:CubicO group peptidase (beta-lactamase class C family)